jgi:1-acyl-sn-glycerol-3-phosphate acyltransferase
VQHTTPKSSIGPAYRGIATLVRPTIRTLTKRDWHGMDRLAFEGPCVIASNHISWADPLLLAEFIWSCDRVPRFLGKHQVFDVPVLGPLLHNAGQIPVYRETEQAADAVRAAVKAIEKGETVVVYPDGTVTKDPDLWPMCGKTGAARIALTTGVPLIPVAQWGAQDMMAPGSKVLKLFPLKTTYMSVGEPIDLDDLRGRDIDADVLATATGRLVRELTRLLAEIRGEPAPVGCWDRRTSSRRSDSASDGSQ